MRPWFGLRRWPVAGWLGSQRYWLLWEVGFVATRVFADEELARLREFPEIGREELFRFFTLSPADLAFVDPGRGRGPADRHRDPFLRPPRRDPHRPFAPGRAVSGVADRRCARTLRSRGPVEGAVWPARSPPAGVPTRSA
ncbi:putative transposase [Nocardia cyriacigeorgica GUH-2]|uniref:Putative transposase n=1 Tax=Nocardia cyriacigeorgica (strain GUH-2) TaxID=1127134 RepID=H6R6X6_NOCCG|nr:putative transposase [Nocardia cyriacigeorgica GUH-2]